MSTTTTATVLERVFRLGSITLSDPDRNLLPEDAIRLYSANYPIIDACSIGEPFTEGERVVYPIVKPDVKTKG